MKVWDFKCRECQNAEERYIAARQEEITQVCQDCGALMTKVIGGNLGWVVSKERTYEQLKKRSHDHTRRCNEKGISLKDNDSGISSDPVWRNKHRAKNTSRSTIDQFANVHKTWGDQPSIRKLD